mgnify:CR=1 FL=1
MNERYKELWSEALSTKYSSSGRTIPSIFAELIVKECADIASINQFQHDAVGNYVKKHFGLEE